MEKFLPKQGKARENYEYREERIIFADLSLLRQIFSRVNHKLIKQIIYYISSIYFVNIIQWNKKSGSRFST